MSAIRHEHNRIVYYTSSLLDSYEIPHAFAGRRGGVGEVVFDSLNVSLDRKAPDGTTDSPDTVRENCERILRLPSLAFAVDTPSEPLAHCAMMKQIHSDVIDIPTVSIGKCFSEPSCFPSCDGLITESDELSVLGVKTADCVPILLYDVRNDVACALHAGWRGSVANIAGKAVARLFAMHADAQIVAAIGPCIGACCYEVDRTVYDACRALSENERQIVFPKTYKKDGTEKFRADLVALNRIFLLHAGLPASNIDAFSLCTCCHDDEFFSHRASHGFSGTQGAFIARKRRKCARA